MTYSATPLTLLAPSKNVISKTRNLWHVAGHDHIHELPLQLQQSLWATQWRCPPAPMQKKVGGTAGAGQSQAHHAGHGDSMVCVCVVCAALQLTRGPLQVSASADDGGAARCACRPPHTRWQPAAGRAAAAEHAARLRARGPPSARGSTLCRCVRASSARSRRLARPLPRRRPEGIE